MSSEPSRQFSSYLAQVIARPVEKPSVCYVHGIEPLAAAQRRLALAYAVYIGTRAWPVDTDLTESIGQLVEATEVAALVLSGHQHGSYNGLYELAGSHAKKPFFRIAASNSFLFARSPCCAEGGSSCSLCVPVGSTPPRRSEAFGNFQAMWCLKNKLTPAEVARKSWHHGENLPSLADWSSGADSGAINWPDRCRIHLTPLNSTLDAQEFKDKQDLMGHEMRAAAWEFFETHCSFRLEADDEMKVPLSFRGYLRTYTLCGISNGWPVCKGVASNVQDPIQLAYLYRFERYNQWMVQQSRPPLGFDNEDMHGAAHVASESGTVPVGAFEWTCIGPKICTLKVVPIGTMPSVVPPEAARARRLHHSATQEELRGNFLF